MTFPIFCACLAALGVFLIGVAAMIAACRKRTPPGNHDLFQK